MNIVFLIGAGASRSDNPNSPLDKDFLALVGEKTERGVPAILEIVKPSSEVSAFRQASSFLKENWGVKLFGEEAVSRSIEEVLCHALRKDSLAFDQLVEIIVRYFTLLYLRNPATQGNYVRLLEYLKTRNRAGERTDILSFNWDCFLEISFIRDTLKAQIDAGLTPLELGPLVSPVSCNWKEIGLFDYPSPPTRPPPPDPVYAFYRDYDQMYSYWTRFFSPPFSHEFGKFGKYLKLHGSLETVKCSVCQKICNRIGIYQPSAESICPSCGKSALRMFVPPVWEKQWFIDNQMLVSQWQDAREAVEGADSIVAWGYSFPRTDTEAKKLLWGLEESVTIDLINREPSEVRARLTNRSGDDYQTLDEYLLRRVR